MRSITNILQALEDELEFLRKGYYRKPLVWKLPLIFEDSPTCPKHRWCACPANCALMGFVPKESRHETAPCRYIPLNDMGETVDSLYRTGTNEEIEQALRNWLLKTIHQLERDPKRQWIEEAA